MSSATSVLFIGATGYIGGSILAQLLSSHPNLQYSAIVRSPKDTAAVEALGVKVYQGTHQEYPWVDKLSSEHDVVINAADADDLPLAEATILGLEKRASSGSSNRKPILIHTSGTGVVTDEATGAFNPGTSEKIWNDNVVEDIKSIDVKQPHREVDLRIFAASEKGVIDAYIIAPSTIYGRGTGPVRVVSQQVPNLIREAVKRKQAVHVGPGTNLWNNVHIKDLVKLYQLVFELALSGNNQNKSYANFYWGSSGEHQWKTVVEAFAKILLKKRLIDTEEVKSISLSELPPIFTATANNSRTVSERGFQLGWKPTEKSLLDTLEEEVEVTLENL
ncbi:hypothetical protein FRC03_012695 [Tulasnella sp. 419]|nr:hypothetical protein FRC02_009169 [Tulasnella sp. 418]KAG8950898.1 hypothetical protein FRC03_012695 [Tulasnella sp. 419]